MNDAAYSAMAHPPLTAHIANDRAWRAAEVPGANGQGNARGIAKVYGALANGGELGGQSIISQRGIEAMTTEECFRKDQVIGVRMRWSRGFILNKAESSTALTPMPSATVAGVALSVSPIARQSWAWVMP